MIQNIPIIVLNTVQCNIYQKFHLEINFCSTGARGLAGAGGLGGTGLGGVGGLGYAAAKAAKYGICNLFNIFKNNVVILRSVLCECASLRDTFLH